VQALEGPGGHTATVTGLIFTGAGIAGAVSSLVAGWFADQLGLKRVIMIGLGITAVLSLPQALVMHAWQLFVLRIAIGLSMGAVMPSASALIANLVPAEKRGTAYGLMGSATSIGFGAGPLAAAGMVAISGMRSVFVMSAVVFSLVTVWVAFTMRTPARADEETTSAMQMERASG